MIEPTSEGGKFLAAALIRDVLHPGRGVGPQEDAIDAPEKPQGRATDPSQGQGTGASVGLTTADRAKREFMDLIEEKLGASVRVR